MSALQIALLSQRNITTPLPNLGTSAQGYVFTEVQSITVCIGPDGGYILPAVRSYPPNSLQAAVDAAVEFQKNKPGGPFKSGHELSKPLYCLVDHTGCINHTNFYDRPRS